jgi:hypothetical protein
VGKFFAGQSVVDNRWHHLAAAFDGACVRLYVDGHETGSTPVTFNLPTPDRYPPLIIGTPTDPETDLTFWYWEWALPLTSWVEARRPIAGKVFLIHGEPPNLKGFARRLEAAGVAQDAVVIAELDRAYRLRKEGAEALAPVPRIASGAVTALDWHNQRADVLMRLNEQLRAAASDAEREALLARVAAALKI